MTKWEAMHSYRRLAKSDKATPLTCPDDGNLYITRIGKDDEPVLYCYFCKTTVIPGISLWKQMEAILNEKIEATP